MTKHLTPSQQGDWPEPTKFDQLRNKTKIQLVHLINAELDLGIRHARQALQSADMGDIAAEYHRRANCAYATASHLIPLVAEITVVETTKDERNRARSRLERLEQMLEALSAIGSRPTPAEDEIATLARAVWEARGCPDGMPEEDWFRAERALKAQRESNAVCLMD